MEIALLLTAVAAGFAFYLVIRIRDKVSELTKRINAMSEDMTTLKEDADKVGHRMNDLCWQLHDLENTREG